MHPGGCGDRLTEQELHRGEAALVVNVSFERAHDVRVDHANQKLASGLGLVRGERYDDASPTSWPPRAPVSRDRTPVSWIDPNTGSPPVASIPKRGTGPVTKSGVDEWLP